MKVPTGSMEQGGKGRFALQSIRKKNEMSCRRFDDHFSFWSLADVGFRPGGPRVFRGTVIWAALLLAGASRYEQSICDKTTQNYFYYRIDKN